MRLTAKTDLDAPASFVFASLADHSSWEREAAQRGIEVERPVDMPLSGVGAGWLVRLPYRGKLIKLLLRLVALSAEDRLDFELQSNSVEGELAMEVIALSPRRTRLHLAIDLRPRTLAARLLLNTLRLAKGRVQSRMEQRVKQIGAQIEARYQASHG